MPIESMPYHPALGSALMAVWRAAAGDRHPLAPALWAAMTEADPAFDPADVRVLAEGDRPVAFALFKREGEAMWITLMAVDPAYQRRGLGSRLLAEAHGGSRLALGGSLHHAMPGVPHALPEAAAFFAHHGFIAGQTVWDVRRNLAEGPELPKAPPPAGVVYRPFEGGLVEFLQGAFPGRWTRDVALYLENGGAIGHVIGAFEGDRPLGFCHIHPPHSPGALRWAGFSPGIAALGPIGVAASERGRGLGLGLLVASLEALQAHGATDTVIDWTTLLDFYARCGFAPWLACTLMDKRL